MQYSFCSRHLLCLASTLICLALARDALSEDTPRGKKVALLVGVNTYDRPRRFRDLEFAERDVRELKRILDKAGYEVQLLTASAKGPNRATLKNIQKAIETLLEDRTKGDLVLIALAGHGLQVEVPGPDGKPQVDSFFCPRDAVPGNTKTMLSMGRLFEEIDRGGGEHNLVLVDACREDPFRGRGMDGSTVRTLPEGVAVLFGCRAGQKTFEHKDAGGGHGIFFHFVLEGLRGKAVNEQGEVTWSRLVEYVSRQVKNDGPLIVGDPGLRQTPNLIANLGGDSPVLLVPSKATPAMLAEPFGERLALARQQQWARFLGKQDVVDENSVGMKLVLIPPGEFLMGSSDAETKSTLADFSAKPEWVAHEKQHRVRITRPYWLGMHEVTVGQFRQFVLARRYKSEAEGDGGAYGYSDAKGELAPESKPEYSWRNTGWTQSDAHPVVNVSWNDVQAFCEWLSAKEGRAYRLASEAEWEYACRAGTASRFSGGHEESVLTGLGNVADQTARATLTKYADSWTWASGRDGHVFTAPVGSLRANAFGLHDTLGNVWEWCHDTFRTDYEALSADDPLNDGGGSHRVIRGGGWNSDAIDCRCARRGHAGASFRNHNLGFRVVAVP